MSDFSNYNTCQFAPHPGDSLRELLRKAEGMLSQLREHETTLRKFPVESVEERRALWQPVADLLTRALDDPSLADDARLEVQRAWAEEMHHSAMWTVTMCVHARTEAAERCFAGHLDELAVFQANLERARPAAMKLLTVEDRNFLRRHGFLRKGE